MNKDNVSKPKSMGCLVTVGVLVVLSVLFSAWYTLTDSDMKYNLDVACTAARDSGLYCNPDVVLETWPDAVEYCQETVGQKPVDYELYILCLQEQGVYMGQ